MKSVLLTRSVEDNHRIIQQIKKYDFNYIHCPLIEYKKLNISPKILIGYSNIIITSKYAAKILKSWQPAIVNLDFDIWVVGEISKNILENIPSFKIIKSAKNIDDLISHFPTNQYKQTIYLSSNEITHELPPQITKQIIYQVRYLDILPKFKDLNQPIDYILLYSQNTAKTLVKLLLKNNSSISIQNSIVVAISLKVANIIRPFVKNVVYCEKENQNSVINLLLDNAKL